jgi:hypothetical protein
MRLGEGDTWPPSSAPSIAREVYATASRLVEVLSCRKLADGEICRVKRTSFGARGRD